MGQGQPPVSGQNPGSSSSQPHPQQTQGMGGPGNYPRGPMEGTWGHPSCCIALLCIKAMYM